MTSASVRLYPRRIWALLALALFMRALVPSGWMPVAHAGTLQIAICSGSGAAMTLVEVDRSTSPETPRDPCPFALGAGQPGDLPAVPAIAAVPNWPDSRLFAQPAAAKLLAWRSIRPPARGPPVLV